MDTTNNKRVLYREFDQDSLLCLQLLSLKREVRNIVMGNFEFHFKHLRFTSEQLYICQTELGLHYEDCSMETRLIRGIGDLSP